MTDQRTLDPTHIALLVMDEQVGLGHAYPMPTPSTRSLARTAFPRHTSVLDVDMHEPWT